MRTKSWPKKYKTVLNELYESHGVGKTVKQKRAFWDKEYPNCYITHARNNREWVKAMELFYVVEIFPEEFKFC